MPPTYTICCVPSAAWGLIALAIRETSEWKGFGNFSVPGEDAKAPEDMEDHRRQQPAEDARRVAAWLFALNGVAEVVEGAVAANDNSLV